MLGGIALTPRRWGERLQMATRVRDFELLLGISGSRDGKTPSKASVASKFIEALAVSSGLVDVGKAAAADDVCIDGSAEDASLPIGFANQIAVMQACRASCLIVRCGVHALLCVPCAEGAGSHVGSAQVCASPLCQAQDWRCGR